MQKKQLIEGLCLLTEMYQMPDDRMYIHETKRKVMRGLTEVAGRAHSCKDRRDALISLDHHKVEDSASNGFIQTENPDMASFAADLQ